MSNKKEDKYTTEIRTPPVQTTDLNNGRVRVEMRIPKLEPGRDKHHPKGGKIDFDIYNSGNSFSMTTVLKDTTKKKRTIYKYEVKQLPGRISIGDSIWGVENGKIVVMMEKHEDSRNIDWQRTVNNRGLEQASSSSSSSSSDDY